MPFLVLEALAFFEFGFSVSKGVDDLIPMVVIFAVKIRKGVCFILVSSNELFASGD